MYVTLLGSVYTPSKFTLTDVSSAHGSDDNAGCPSACVRMVSSVRVCDCVGVTTDRTGITLIDGVIPVFDVSQPHWAAQLYTATSIGHHRIEFKFPNVFMLRQVDLYLYICPLLMIPNQGQLSIRVYQSLLFPLAAKGLFLGNKTLTMEESSCSNLTQISVFTNPSTFSQYLVEFSMENILGGIYIGEVSFTGKITVGFFKNAIKIINDQGPPNMFDLMHYFCFYILSAAVFVILLFPSLPLLLFPPYILLP